MYPYQLKKIDLKKQAEDLFNNSNFNIVIQSLKIPCNNFQELIPSPLIANMNNISDRTIKDFKVFKFIWFKTSL